MGNTLEIKVTKVIDIDRMADVLESWFEDYFSDYEDLAYEEINSIDREAIKKALAKLWLGM